MLDSDSLSHRIREAIDGSGKSRAEIAEQCGVTPQAVNGWLTTGRISKLKIARLASVTGLPLEFFMPTDVPAVAPPAPALRPIVEWSDVGDLDPNEHVVVPRLEMYLSAGSAAGMAQEEPASMPVGQAFRADYVRRRGWSPRTHYSMLVKGSSMEPTIPDGASVVIDISDRNVRSGLIYAVRIDATSEPILKRLHRLPGGVLRVESDNRSPQFAAFDVTPEHLDGFEVIGRAVNVTADL